MNTHLHGLMLILVFSLFSNSSEAATREIQMNIAGWRVSAGNAAIPFPQYLQTEGKFEINYKNKVVADAAEVYAYITYGGKTLDANNRETEYTASEEILPMTLVGRGQWKVETDKILHKVGSRTQITSISFKFEIVNPQTPGEFDYCENEESFTAEFTDLHDLKWRTDPSAPLEMEDAYLFCGPLSR